MLLASFNSDLSLLGIKHFILESNPWQRDLHEHRFALWQDMGRMQVNATTTLPSEWSF